MTSPISTPPQVNVGQPAPSQSPVRKGGAEASAAPPATATAVPPLSRDEDAWLLPARAPEPQSVVARRTFGSLRFLASFQCLLLTGFVALMLQVVPTLANGGGGHGSGGGHGGHGGIGGHGHGHGGMGGHHHGHGGYGGGYTGNSFATLFSVMFAWMMCRRRPRD